MNDTEDINKAIEVQKERMADVMMMIRSLEHEEDYLDAFSYALAI